MNTDELAALIESVIDSEPMHRRLYPDLYARKVAEAIEQAQVDRLPEVQ